MEHEPLFEKIRMESYWPTKLRNVQQQVINSSWWQANSQSANQYFMYYCNSSCTKSKSGNFLSIFFKELWIDHLLLKFHKSMFSQFSNEKEVTVRRWLTDIFKTHYGF
jgi:hypothetical protein